MATVNEDDKLSFIVEWYDPPAALVRKYLLNFYEYDSTVEMYDLKNRRSFLRRSKVDNVRMCDMYIGSTINILSRQLTFADYATEYTRKRLGYKKERTLCLVMPDGFPNIGKILDIIWHGGLQITKVKSLRLNRTEVSNVFYDERCKVYFNDLVGHVSSANLVAIEMRGENAVQRFLDLLGPSDPAEARDSSPMSIRARFGSDCIRNAAYGPTTAEAAERELDILFPPSGPPWPNTACFTECTCCVIKPHSITDGIAGDIISKILECGFEISAILMLTLERANAEEFLEVYKGVVQEYPNMVTEISTGPCIALEIRAQNAPQTFREFVGPADPEIARHLRPRTLRALFGRNKSQNAVHCTDLPEDGVLEVEYFFKILDR